MTQIRAAAYLRQSLDVAEGIDRQQERTAALITARGWAPGPVYIDIATSASKARGNGTAWARMLDGIGTDFDVLVAVDLDRLLRTTRDLNVLIERGAKVVTVDGEIDLTTADGEFRATMLAGIARFETRRKSERMVRANEHRVSRGRASSVPRERPFGFEKDGITHRSAEAATIRDAYADYVAGASLGSIARHWNERGFTTARGNEWASGSVALVLANPRYYGQVVYHRRAAGRAVWDPIIDETTWTAARARLTVGTSGRGAYPMSLLGKLAFCGVCDDGTFVRSGSNNGRRSYRCDGKVQHLSRKAEAVESYVEAVVLELLQDERIRQGLARRGPAVDEGEAERIRQRMDALAQQYADEAITDSQLRTATERLRSRLAEVQQRMEAASAGAGFEAVANAKSPTEAWRDLDVRGKRKIIERLVDVTLLPAPRGRKEFDESTVMIEPKGTNNE